MAAPVEEDSPCVGIDLGTTYSCVGFYSPKEGAVTIITNQSGNRTTPSIVAFNESDRLVGEAAKNQAIRNPTNTVFDSKRMIGHKFMDETIQKDMKLWPFKVVKNPQGEGCVAEVTFQGKQIQLTPEEISAAVLKHLKKAAEDYLGKPVTRAVITVPAYFNDAQRQATIDAGDIAGLKVERIINEPTAAAMAYGFDKGSPDKQQNLLIFDLGGGTFDVTLLVVDGNVFEVKSTCGDTHLGGQDFDNFVLEYCLQQYESKYPGSKIREDPKALRKLRGKCTDAKHVLSQSLQTSIEIDALHDGHDFDLQITRAKFEELCEDAFVRCLEPVKKALSDANIQKQQIDEIVLIGGSTRIPRVQTILQEFFEGKQLCRRINPDEAVAYGAAVLAANLSLTVQEKSGSKLSGLTLMDVTALSLGIELVGGKMSVLIPRNTCIPYSHTRTYYNNEDNQTEAHIQVFEGENIYTKENRLLGDFELRNLPQRPRGKVPVNVSFSIDANGILEVTAALKDDQQVTQKLVINQNKGLLRKEQIELKRKLEEDIEKEQQERHTRMKSINEIEQLALKLKRSLNASDPSSKEKMDALENIAEWVTKNSSKSTIDELKDRKKQLEVLLS